MRTIGLDRTRRHPPRRAALALACLIALATAPGAAAETPSVPPPPANDEASSAQPVGDLPATLTGTAVGATVAAGEPQTGCGAQPAGSVWYSLHTDSNPQRIALELKATGALEVDVDVYRLVRSQLISAGCERTEEEGLSSLTFKPVKNSDYLIRVAALTGSQLAGFTLNVFQPTPAVAPPGPPLPTGGASGHVDRIQNVNAAYSVTLRSGTSYILNLRTTTRRGACVSASLFAPGTTSFEGGSPVLGISCGGYRLFTPGPGQGGRYSIELTPSRSHIGVQAFHIQVGRAGLDETAPGVPLGNYELARGHLDGAGVHVLRLYRIAVFSHSTLTLLLHAPRRAAFNVRLLDQDGAQIACGCGGRGSLGLRQRLRPGRYYVAVSSRNGTAGGFSLERESRTITHTKIYFANAHARKGRARAPTGHSTPLHVRVSPAASGPLTIDIQRFDPVFGWQFYREVHAHVARGVASIPFTAPTVGQWRAEVIYRGSRVSSPSRASFVYLLAT